MRGRRRNTAQGLRLVNAARVTAAATGRSWRAALTPEVESHGEPGRIQVTAQAPDRYFDRYRFDGPSSISVKGKGETETSFLAELCDDRPKEPRLGLGAIELRET